MLVRAVIALWLIGLFTNGFAKIEELARVAILDYVDKTGSKKYAYLSGSLSDAIDRSMQAQFEYRRVPPLQAQERADKLVGEGGTLQKRSARQLAEQADYDIIISGFYQYDIEAKQVVFYTFIYLEEATEWLPLPITRNKVDATLFQSTEKVAKLIVSEVERIAREQEERRRKEAAKPKPKPKPGGKTKLTKQATPEVTELPVGYLFKKWHIGYRGGFRATVVEGIGDGFASGLFVTRDMWWRLYLGALGGFDILYGESSSQSSGDAKVEMANASGYLGMAWKPGKNWRLYVDSGAGYYIGTLIFNNNSGNDVAVKNPYFSVRAGFYYLLFESWAIGGIISMNQYYDEPDPLNFLGLDISFAYIF